jgi:hypothetical protein
MHRTRRQLFAERSTPRVESMKRRITILSWGRNDDRDVRDDRLRNDGAIQSPCGMAEGERLSPGAHQAGF